MSAGHELTVHRQQEIMGLQKAQDYLQMANNTGQNMAGCCQYGLGSQLQPQWCYHCSHQREPTEFELTIVQYGADNDPLLNYGAKLRLLIADPIKGMHLREAIHQLKTALKEAYGKPA